MERREALENPREGKKRRGNAEGDSSSGPAAPSPSAEQPLFVSGSDRDRGEEGGGMGWNKAQMGGGGEGGVGAGMSSEEWAEASRLLAQTATQIERRVAPKGGRLIWEVLEEEQERWLDEHERHAGVGELLEEAKLAVGIAEASPDVVLPLLRYQKEWLAWALKQEASSYKGGILADEMGMGKTIEAIALVLTARPTGSSAQGTLVICPLVALNQWASEIERHTRKGSVRVLVYHGSKRFKMEREYDFNGYDFVLTTYHTMEGDFRRTLMQPKEKCNWCGKMLVPKRIKIHLMKHCKSFAQRTKKETSMPSLEQAQSSVSNNKTGRRRNSQRGSNDTGKDDEPTDNPEKFTSVLHTVKWERIILDEAHFIKDARSNTARAVFAFQSLYKWALSGTPFQSHIRELYSLQEEIVHMIEGDSCAKGIVFSQFTSFLDLINYSLKMSGIMCVQFVGSMTHIQRENAITLFTENDDCKIFLTSLKAGGVALNLKVASHVFLMEPWWNTAVERQAQDRIHRIGQHKPVRTMKFVIEGTIEERILQMQKKREKVFEGTFGDSTEDMAQLTEADLKFLFRS